MLYRYLLHMAFCSLSLSSIYAAEYQLPQSISPFSINCKQGKRAKQEDRFTFWQLDKKRLLCAIFDGHTNEFASTYIAQELPKILKQKKKDPLKQLKEAYLKIDYNLKRNKQSKGSGTTAIAALLIGSNLYIANTGDSGLILVDETGNLLYSTNRHTLANQQERARLKKTNSFFTNRQSWKIDEKKVNKVNAENAKHIYINSKLNITRSIGDGDRAIIPTPDITSIELQTQHAFLLLASDGLWDVATYQECATIIHKHLNQKACSMQPCKKTQTSGSLDCTIFNNEALQKASNELLQKAQTSGDNGITMLVDLRNYIKNIPCNSDKLPQKAKKRQKKPFRCIGPPVIFK